MLLTYVFLNKRSLDLLVLARNLTGYRLRRHTRHDVWTDGPHLHARIERPEGVSLMRSVVRSNDAELRSARSISPRSVKQRLAVNHVRLDDVHVESHPETRFLRYLDVPLLDHVLLDEIRPPIELV